MLNRKYQLHTSTGHWQLGLCLSLIAAFLWGILPIALKNLLDKMDAYTVLGLLKKDSNVRDMPVVTVAGVGQELNKKLAKQMGAVGYISKPFKAQELLDAIDKYL